jgi:outer membrane receptor protein involved in Fe transport
VKIQVRLLAFALAAGIGLPATAIAQNAGATLLVEARDPNGAPVAGALVTITNQDTSLERVGTTVDDGTVWLVRLPAGIYTLSAVRDGFKTEVIKGIAIDAAARGKVTLIFKSGAYTEQIVVQADATTLKIGNSAVGAVFDSHTLLTVPVPEREPLEFAAQAAGVATAAPGSRLSTQGNTGVNSAGAREAANNYLLDGVDNNDQFLNRLIINPSLDAIQEFAIQQNTYDAEYGRSAGAQLNMVVKSGTRTIQGSAYEYFRDSTLQARDALDDGTLPRPELQRNQFGGTIGGPLWFPRSFFFINAEGIDGTESDTRLAHVPTALEREGNFSASGVVIKDPFTGLPFPGNTIPANRISAASLASANLYPMPNRSDPVTNFVSSPLADRQAGQFTIKTDHVIWNGSPLMFRYSFSRDNEDNPFPVRARNLPGFGTTVLDKGQNFAAALTKAVSSRMYNELRVGVNALYRNDYPQSQGTDQFAALGITGPPLTSIDQGYPTMIVSGYETLGDDTNLPVLRRTRTIHVSDALTIDRGRHHLKAGGEFHQYQSDGYNHLFSRGQMTFSGAFTGQPFADFLLGFPTVTLLAANDNRQALRTWSGAGFVQDDWRITQRLTVNAGVRYEYFEPPYDTDNRMAILNLTTLEVQQVGQAGVSRSGLNRDLNNVAPRAGVSYDLTGSGQWLLRGGYGIFYDSGTLIENSALYFNPPYWTLSLWVPNPVPVSIANPFPPNRALSTAPTINTINPDFHNGYSQQGTAGVDGVVKGTSINVRYVMSYGYDLVRKANINQPIPGPGLAGPRRPDPSLGDVLLVESTGTSTYHALNATVTRHIGHDIELRAAYTLSKAMDNTSAFLETDGDDNTPQDSRNLGPEWGPSDYDVRNHLVLTGIVSSPDSAPVWLRHWQASALFTAMSGRPFTPRVSFDNSNTGNVGGGSFAYDRPNIVPAGTPGAVSYDGHYFVIAPQYTFGDAGRNSLVGPGYASLDAMISRQVRIGEHRQLTLRLEVFNALNRKNLQLPDSFVDHVTFGQSLAAYPPRQGQLVARFNF